MKAKTRFFNFLLSCIFLFRSKGYIEDTLSRRQALPLLYNCECLNNLAFFCLTTWPFWFDPDEA